MAGALRSCRSWGMRSSLLYRLSSTSTSPPPRRVRTTLQSIRSTYGRGVPLTMLTAYDYPTALHADRAGVDLILIGDSLGMVVLGAATTQSVTTDQMVHHCQAARRGVTSGLLVADLPFGSYETSAEQAVGTAMRLVKEAGADAVKLEGGRTRKGVLEAVVDAGIAVVGHVGLMPQAVSRLGGFRAMGRSSAEAMRVLDDARAVQEAGAFAVVVECVPGRLAGVVTASVGIPTIGIGSGVQCDGQVLVYHDMLGILSHPHHAEVSPKFSKQFASLGPVIHDAIGEYCRQVRERDFPGDRYSPYAIDDDEFEEFLSASKSLKTKAGGAHHSSENETVLPRETTQPQERK